MRLALRVVAKKRHLSLLIAHLESPNHAPRASIGAFLVTTEATQVRAIE